MNLEAIREAAQRIAPHLHRTPLVTSRFFDERTGARVHFKCECFQKTGAFKARGAYNAVFALDDATAARGVCAASSGNHAGALASAARARGIAAHVVMPEGAVPIKREATEGYGATIYECSPGDAPRAKRLDEVAAQTGAHCVSSHDDPHVIAGQGTAMLEIFDEVDDLDVVLAPVGGGGLLSGTAIACRALHPSVRVIGCEPQGADDAARSVASGTWHPQENPQTIADGLRTSLGKNYSWPTIRENVDEILCVEEDEILEALRLFWTRTKILIEASSAVAVAALLRGDFAGKRVAVILSGGNCAPQP